MSALQEGVSVESLPHYKITRCIPFELENTLISRQRGLPAWPISVVGFCMLALEWLVVCITSCLLYVMLCVRSLCRPVCEFSSYYIVRRGQLNIPVL